MTKIIAMLSGGDWVDASVSHAVNISGRSGEELFNEYLDYGGYHGNSSQWFKDWAIGRGYFREASDDELEIVVEY